MSPTPIPTIIIPPYYSGELTPDMMRVLTVVSPMPGWFVTGLVIGVLIGMVIMLASIIWWARWRV